MVSLVSFVVVARIPHLCSTHCSGCISASTQEHSTLRRALGCKASSALCSSRLSGLNPFFLSAVSEGLSSRTLCDEVIIKITLKCQKMHQPEQRSNPLLLIQDCLQNCYAICLAPLTLLTKFNLFIHSFTWSSCFRRRYLCLVAF